MATKGKGDTWIGGQAKSFTTTHWSDIYRAQTNSENHRKKIVQKLITKYWKPVYCYLRRRGYQNESAKDLTQAFFCEVVLRRQLIQQADHAKGRFRTFLLVALDRYLIDVYRKEDAAKRCPEVKILSDTDKIDDAELSPDLTYEEAFNNVWVSDLLDNVIAELKTELQSAGKTLYWQIFNSRVLIPIVDDSTPPSLVEICKQFGVESEEKASNMMVTVKRRFRAILERSIRQIVQSDCDVQEELGEIINLLSKYRAR
jgi:RNA polymerase sigma factor (sigma-70 family)